MWQKNCLERGISMGLSLIAQEGKVVNVYLVNNDYIKIAPFDNREDYLIIRNIDG